MSTIVLCPLEVIATRLAVQRNHASAEYNSVSQEEEEDVDDVADYYGAEEDVIGCAHAPPLKLVFILTSLCFLD